MEGKEYIQKQNFVPGTKLMTTLNYSSSKHSDKNFMQVSNRPVTGHYQMSWHLYILTENCLTPIFIIIVDTNDLTDAQFKRQTFHVPHLIPIWVDPNDTSSTVDFDVEFTLNSLSPCTMVYNAYQWK